MIKLLLSLWVLYNGFFLEINSCEYFGLRAVVSVQWQIMGFVYIHMPAQPHHISLHNRHQLCYLDSHLLL